MVYKVRTKSEGTMRKGEREAAVAEVVGTTVAPHDALIERAKLFAQGARSTATQKAYKSDWCHYVRWCETKNFEPLAASPFTLGLYLTAHADNMAPATLARRVSAVAIVHRLAGLHLDTRHPAIRDVLSGIRRMRGTAPRRAAPTTTALVRRMVGVCAGNTMRGLRDRVLILVGFSGAFRRSELCAIERDDLTFNDQGVRIRLKRSKRDQEGAGEFVGIMRIAGSTTCPVAALEAWLTAAAITSGPMLRGVDRHGRVADTALSDRTVARVVQRLVAALGLNPADYAGHSLRAGFATSAAAHGVEERRIAKQTRHKSNAVRTYIRDGELFVKNPSIEVGL